MLLIEPRAYFDACIVGIVYADNRAVYDAEKVIQTFMDMNGWDYDDALEWFEYNTIRSLPYYENSPIFVNFDFDLENFEDLESLKEEGGEEDE